MSLNLPHVCPTVCPMPKAKLPFSLFQRGGVWFYAKMIRGRRVRQTLHTDDYNLALAAARKLHAEQLESNFAAFQDLSARGWATARELEAAYLGATDVRASEASRRRNFGDLDRAVRLLCGGGPREWHVGFLTHDFAPRWKAKRLAKAREECAGDALALEAAKRALNSTLAHWQSVFSSAALEAYRAARLKLPDRIAELAAAPGVPAEPVPEVEPLTAAELEALEHGAVELRQRDPGTWAVYQLMAYCGLRNIECAAAVWDWVGRRGDEWFVRMTRTADFKPKGSRGAVGIERARVAALLELRRAGDPHIVPAAHQTDREDACYRRINAWLTACGVNLGTGGKRAYRLRRQFGATVLEEQGVEAAMAALRHGDTKMQRNYVSSTAKIAAPVGALRGGDAVQGAAAVDELKQAAPATVGP